MTNPYGITLDPRWAQWAAAVAVPEVVAAALQLIDGCCTIDAVASKLTSAELAQVIDLVRAYADSFPFGALAALEKYRATASHQPVARNSDTRNSDTRNSTARARMRKTRERKRNGLCVLRLELPMSAVEAAKRGDLTDLVAALLAAVE